ncbi:SPL family radical SAM protein [Cohnella caldifontis]|uniref:SPL family radical SAM protein n=1 Tax=Cohnella caldifontis TaxID=3027471 RepID=UPI0023ED541A|nr:radical SAM protein [Cohnella sp. YIM B05605]
MNPTTYEPIRPKTVLNPVKAPSMPFDWSINPYRGCQHGCSFCYARSTHAYMGESADDAFQKHIFWKQDAPDVLRAQLRRMRGRLPAYVAIGTATDPYQQLEGKARLTRGCLETLAEFGVPASITTRSPLVLRDLDLLQRIPGSSVNISLHMLDPDVWRNFEPSTPAPRLRLDAVRRLNEAGIKAGVFMAPILPYISDGEEAVEGLLDACQQADAAFVSPSYLRLSTPEVKSWFFQTLQEAYPEHVKAYGRLYWRAAYVPEAYRKPKLEWIRRQIQARGLRSQELAAIRSPKPAADVPNASALSPADDGPVQLTLF